MSKIKMRCTTCGKWFQSANAKEVTCPDCVQKARKEKLAAKTAPPSSIKSGQGTMSSKKPLPPPPKPATSGTSHWLVPPGWLGRALGGGGPEREGFTYPGPAGLLTGGGAFFAAIFSFRAFCIQSGQVTSLAFAD